MSNVRISQLSGFTNILGEDFIPMVDSSSLTTYRATITSLVGYFAASGSVLSASWASASISSSFATNAVSSSYAKTASFLNYPNISTASVAISSSWATAGLSASYARSASAANSASFSTSNLSSSYAASASNANTASYVNFTTTVPNFASHSLSSSYASSSLSSSYALSASWANSASVAGSASYISSTSAPAIAKAWVCFLATGSFSTSGANSNVQIISSYNVASVKVTYTTSGAGAATWQLGGGYNYGNAIITFTNPLPNTDYVVLGMAAESGQTGQSYICQAWPNHSGEIGVATPSSPPLRTTMSFSMSLDAVNANRSATQFMFCNAFVF